MGKLRANSEIISDKSKNPVTTSTYIKHGNQWLDDAVNNAIGAAASKADKTYVDSELTKKANKSDTDAALSTKADKSALEATNASVSANTSNIQGLSTESAALSARMDEFTKLKEGSTTGDAELTDGRVGADGKTYTNIGGAIRGQVTDLKSDLNTSLIRNDLNFSITGYLGKSGELHPLNTDWKSTDYIAVNKSDINAKGNWTTCDVGFNIAFYNDSYEFIRGANTTGGIINVPDDAKYIRVCIIAAEIDKQYFWQTKIFAPSDYSEVKESVNEISNAVFERIETALSLSIDGYTKSDGTFSTNSSWHRTSYLLLDGFESATVSFGELSESVGFNVAYFGSDKSFILGYRKEDGESTISKYEIPENAKYVVFSSPKSVDDSNNKIIYKKNKISYRVIYVNADGTADFTSVSNAVNSCVGGETIRVSNGIYDNEHIEAWGKNISIIGESKNGVLIRCSDSTYENPCIEFSVGLLENMTFEKLGSDSSGYVLHCEDDFQYGKYLTIKNCDFISEKTNSVGMGMRGNSKIVFESCGFYNTKNQGSCFYLHDANENPYVGIFDIEFNQCRFNNLGNYIMQLQSQEKSDSIVNFGFYNCLFWGNGSPSAPYIACSNYRGGTSTNPDDFNGLINWRLKKDSFGNNLTALNALPTYTGIKPNE